MHCYVQQYVVNKAQTAVVGNAIYMSPYWIRQARHTHYIHERKRKKSKKKENKTNVCVFFTLNRSFYPVDIQHNQCPCRFSKEKRERKKNKKKKTNKTVVPVRGRCGRHLKKTSLFGNRSSDVGTTYYGGPYSK